MEKSKGSGKESEKRIRRIDRELKALYKQRKALMITEQIYWNRRSKLIRERAWLCCA